MALKTPDRTPGPDKEEEIFFEDRGPGGDSDGDPTVEGALRRVTDTLRFFIGGVVTQIAKWRNVPTGFDGIDLDVVIDGDGLVYSDTSKRFEPAYLSGTDELVKVSSNDTTPGYLNGKLVEGDDVFLTELNDGADETLEIKASKGWRRHFLLMGG